MACQFTTMRNGFTFANELSIREIVIMLHIEASATVRTEWKSSYI